MKWLIALFIVFLSKGTTSQDVGIVQDAKNHPDSAVANHLAGEYYLKDANIAAAIPYLEKSHALDPANYVDGYDLALAYLQNKLTDKSRQIVSEMIKQGDKAELHNLLGDINEVDGRLDDAAREYEIAARIDPNEKNLFDLGSDLLNHQGYRPALTVFEFAIQRYPKSAKLRVGLGVSYYSLGQYDNAVEALCRAVDLNPKDTKALDFLGKMQDISSAYAQEVEKHLSDFAREYPSNAAAQYFYALSLLKHGDSNRQAEHCLLRAIDLSPGFTDAHYQLGVFYQAQGSDNKAVAQFEIATSQRPIFVQAHYHLAQLYKKLGRVEMADKEFSLITAQKAQSSEK
jgi:tetratricopeptide (TPR) repeat protein